jgi:hypothetical protein
MNSEKIRNLAESAGTVSIMNGKIWLFANGQWNDIDKFVERFAEAIVKDCCKEITQEPFNAGGASAWIKTKFGISEK